jgi:hypothetical protein
MVKCVLFAVRTEFLNIIYISLFLSHAPTPYHPNVPHNFVFPPTLLLSFLTLSFNSYFKGLTG